VKNEDKERDEKSVKKVIYCDLHQLGDYIEYPEFP
jgi:hypothetical protein